MLIQSNTHQIEVTAQVPHRSLIAHAIFNGAAIVNQLVYMLMGIARHIFSRFSFFLWERRVCMGKRDNHIKMIKIALTQMYPSIVENAYHKP